MCGNGYRAKISQGTLPALLEPTANLADDDDDDASDVEVVIPHTRPRNWTFRGSAALFLFGPTAENKSRGTVLSFSLYASDPEKDDKKAHGRKAVREDIKKAEKVKRDHDANRGHSDLMEILYQTVAMQSSQRKTSKKESLLFSLNVSADRHVKQMDLASKRAQSTGEWEKYDNLEKELDEVNASIKELNAEIAAPSPVKSPVK